MIPLIKQVFNRYLGHPEAGLLFSLIMGLLFIVEVCGQMLAPLFASLIIAYLLQALVNRVDRLIKRPWLSVLSVYIFFLAVVVVSIVFLIPLLWQQSINLITELPNMLGRGQAFLLKLQQAYPQIFTAAQVNSTLLEFRGSLAHYGHLLLSFSLASIPSLVEIIIYLVLVPLLIYFFLMDKIVLLTWLNGCIPSRRLALNAIWSEVHLQLGNYIKGKVIEMIIVMLVTYLTFVIIHLPYALLLSALVGVSVLIPYIGALVVTVPVMVVGFMEWGWGSHFIWLVALYATIITLDGNVLVPLLFSEAVSLHPVGIIVSVLFFGGIWGFWGIFFAIPLASVVKATLEHWPYLSLGPDLLPDSIAPSQEAIIKGVQNNHAECDKAQG